MNDARIHLLLSDDWELRGDGSGDMRVLQFATLRRLCDVYEEHGIRGSFNAEVFQQIAHRQAGEQHPELGALADEWEEAVHDAYRRGHDIQLHLHPQWDTAAYRGGRWHLGDSWSLADHPREAVTRMVREGKAFLERVVGAVEPGYECVSFRAGSWSIAPSDSALDVLAEAGIVFDMSIAAGLYYDSAEVQLDYRQVDEPFLAYYPDMSDARRVSDRPQPIVCVPTHTYAPGLRNRAARALVRRCRRLPVDPPRAIVTRHLAPADVPIPAAGHRYDYAQLSRASRSPKEHSTATVSDLVNLSYAQMREVLDDIRRRVDATDWPAVPVVLENHTKDVGDFRPLDRFARLLSRSSDVAVVTAREVAENIRRKHYPIRTADGG